MFYCHLSSYTGHGAQETTPETREKGQGRPPASTATLACEVLGVSGRRSHGATSQKPPAGVAPNQGPDVNKKASLTMP